MNTYLVHFLRDITLLTLLLSSTFVSLPSFATPPLDTSSIDTELESIRAVNYEDSPRAIELLTELEGSITNSSPLSIRRKFLSILISAQNESGALNKAWENAQKLEDMGVEESDVASQAEALASKGSILMSRGQMNESIGLLHQAIGLAESIPDHKIALFAYNNLASAENLIGEFEQSLSHFLKAVQLSEQIGENQDRNKAVLLNNISLLYMSLKDPQKGLEYNQRAFIEARKSGSQNMLATLYINKGYAYDDQGLAEEAYSAYKEALALGKATHSIRTEAVALINITDYFLRQEDFSTATDYGERALAASLSSADESNIATANINLGLALAGRGNVKEGAAKVVAAIELLKEFDSQLDVELTLGDLAQLYENAGMYKESMETLIEKMALSESLYKSEREKAVRTLQEKFNATERQKKIETLERENTIKTIKIENDELQQQITVLAATLVVFAATLLFLLYRKVRKTNLELESANSKLEIQSISDPLTGLLNRRSFLKLMESRTINEGRRASEPDKPNALILIDVDNFKRINDTYGHSAGDAVLVEISRRLTNLMRDSDMILRWGGEEFLAYVKEITLEDMKHVVKKILNSIGSEPIALGDKSISVTVSAGAISLPFSGLSENDFDWERAIKIADMALYLGKVHGRNRAYCVDKLLVPYDTVASKLEEDLADAMEKELIEVESIAGPTSRNNDVKKG